MSLSSATISIQPNASPTVNTFLGLVKDVLPAGIYNGGGIYSGPGRSIAVQPFTVKSKEGLTISTSAVETLAVPSVLTNTVYWLVLYARAWNPDLGSITAGHLVEFRLVLDADIDVDSDLEYYIKFGRFVATPSATSVRILNSYIDSNVGDRINIQNTVGSQLIYSGTAAFSGQTGTIINHNLGTVNYRVSVTPSETPQVGLGDIWVSKNSNYFIVYCIGDESINFDWQLTLAKNSSGSVYEGFSNISVTGEYEGYTKIEFGASTINTTALYSNIISGDPDSNEIIYSKVDTTTNSDDSWSLSVGSIDSSTNPNISLRWKLLDSSSNTDLIIQTINSPGAYSYDHGIGSLNYMAFLVPQFYTTRKPLITRNIISVDFDSLESGDYRLIIVKNIDKYIHGTMSGTGSMQAYHSISGNYVPLISFVESDADVTEMSIIPSDNKFNTYIDTGVTATAEWLIL